MIDGISYVMCNHLKSKLNHFCTTLEDNICITDKKRFDRFLSMSSSLKITEKFARLIACILVTKKPTPGTKKPAITRNLVPNMNMLSQLQSSTVERGVSV